MNLPCREESKKVRLDGEWGGLEALAGAWPPAPGLLCRRSEAAFGAGCWAPGRVTRHVGDTVTLGYDCGVV